MLLSADSSQQALDRSIVSTDRTLGRLVAKERLTWEQAEAAMKRINVQNDLQVCCGCRQVPSFVWMWTH